MPAIAFVARARRGVRTRGLSVVSQISHILCLLKGRIAALLALSGILCGVRYRGCSVAYGSCGNFSCSASPSSSRFTAFRAAASLVTVRRQACFLPTRVSAAGFGERVLERWLSKVVDV